MRSILYMIKHYYLLSASYLGSSTLLMVAQSNSIFCSNDESFGFPHLNHDLLDFLFSFTTSLLNIVYCWLRANENCPHTIAQCLCFNSVYSFKLFEYSFSAFSGVILIILVKWLERFSTFSADSIRSSSS